MPHGKWWAFGKALLYHRINLKKLETFHWIGRAIKCVMPVIYLLNFYYILDLATYMISLPFELWSTVILTPNLLS